MQHLVKLTGRLRQTLLFHMQFLFKRVEAFLQVRRSQMQCFTRSAYGGTASCRIVMHHLTQKAHLIAGSLCLCFIHLSREFCVLLHHVVSVVEDCRLRIELNELSGNLRGHQL